MSVVGIDVGNMKSKVAVARRGGIDVAVNDVSNRETPSLVAFSGNERFMGETANMQLNSNPQNTIGDLIKILGKKYDNPSLALVKELAPFKLADENGVARVQVQYENQTQLFKPERLVGMLLSKLRETAESELKTKVTDCVLAIPHHFGPTERQAMIDAARIVGLNPLCLIHNTTAAALQWGFYKSPSEGQIVCFLDCGHASFDVAIVQFHKDKLTVLGRSSTTKFCSSELDMIIAKHVAKVSKEKYKIDVFSRPKPKLRVFQSSEKAKTFLSANTSCPIQIECLMDDVDVSFILTREEFEVMSRDHMNEIAPCIQAAIESAGVKKSDISAIEVVGGSSYIPMVQKTLTEIFDPLPIGHSLNASDSIAKGACLRCAMLSATLKVRNYEIKDYSPYNVTANWASPEGDETKSVSLFGDKTELPCRKMLTFKRDQPFNIELVNSTSGESIMTCRISGMKDRETRKREREEQAQKDGEQNVNTDDIGPNKIKVTFEINLDGIVVCEGAHVVEEYEVEVPIKVEETKTESQDVNMAETNNQTSNSESTQAENPTPRKPATTQDEDMKDPATQSTETNASAAEATTPAAATTETATVQTQKKKKVKKIDIVAESTPFGLTTKALQAESDDEWRLIAKDREIIAHKSAKNGLESYVYDTREKISQSYSKLTPFVVEQERTTFLSKLQFYEDWLYSEEGESATTAILTEKLNELKQIGTPIEQRYLEAENRPAAFSTVESAIQANRDWAQTTDAKFAHISQEDRDSCLKKCDEVTAALQQRKAKIESQPKYEQPAFSCNDILQLEKEINNFCKPLMNKPKPAPKKEEEKKEGEQTQAQGEQKEEKKEGEQQQQQQPEQPQAQPQAQPEQPQTQQAQAPPKTDKKKKAKENKMDLD